MSASSLALSFGHDASVIPAASMNAEWLHSSAITCAGEFTPEPEELCGVALPLPIGQRVDACRSSSLPAWLVARWTARPRKDLLTRLSLLIRLAEHIARAGP